MISVEDAARLVDVYCLFRPLLPRQCEHPVEVRTDHHGLGAGGRHPFQASQFLLHPVPGRLGQFDSLQPLAVFIHLGRPFVVFAELFADGLQLLPQHILLLVLLDLLPHPALDAVFEIR